MKWAVLKNLFLRWHNPIVFSGINEWLFLSAKTGFPQYVGGESCVRGRVYANILIGHV